MYRSHLAKTVGMCHWLGLGVSNNLYRLFHHHHHFGHLHDDGSGGGGDDCDNRSGWKKFERREKGRLQDLLFQGLHTFEGKSGFALYT